MSYGPYRSVQKSAFGCPSQSRGLQVLARLGIAPLFAVLFVALGAASAGATTDSGITGSKSLGLPAGHGAYFFVGSTSGEQPMGSISWLEGQDLAVSASSSHDQAISIGHTSSDTGSYASLSTSTATAGVGLDGYVVVQTFSAQVGRPAHKPVRPAEKPVAGPDPTLSFKTTATNQRVLILAGGQGTGTLALSGIEATTLQDATYGAAHSPVIASAAAYFAQLPVGKHKAKLHSTTFAPNPGTSVGAVAYILAPAPAPTVTGVSPTTGPETGGTTVTLTGTNLDGATAVKFGTSNAASFKILSPTSIEAVSPSGTGTSEITVTTERGTSVTSPADQFSYLPPPAITGVNPNSGPEPGGTIVTLTGTNFTGATAVKFGSANAESFNVVSPTSIEAVSPTGSGTVDVTVTDAYGTSTTSASDQFSYIPPPAITGVSPNSGPEAGGTTVTISGTNLAGATAVRFGAANAASFRVTSPSSIEATSPSGSGTVQVTVTDAYGTSATSSADQFTYVTPPPPPSITASKGGPFRGGYTLNIQVHNFPLGTFIYYCHDNSGPGGSDTIYFSHAVEVTNSNQGTWPGVFCYDSAPYVSYLVMDGVRSNSVQF